MSKRSGDDLSQIERATPGIETSVLGALATGFVIASLASPAEPEEPS